ncbi:hypothetical protein IFM89_007410 [Coptis chinensis]|uniref:Uncharacterized protein n=1 Tax=Coptis chinensis TaxID=261450 RepID=A0A835M4R4_9MAGN|nr:hypothetical protein IFM89_007410 [Coptis chinensis]
MKDYGVSWTKDYVIRKDTLGPLQGTVVPIKILSPTKKGIVLLHGGKGQGYYDLEKKEFKQILIDGIAMGVLRGRSCPHWQPNFS